MSLTAQQERFIEEFVIDSNGAQAAIRAGYSPSDANTRASRLLKKPEVQQALAEARKKISSQLNRTAQDVLRDIHALYQEAKIAGKINSALNALELEGKAFGMWKQKIEISGQVDHKHYAAQAAEMTPQQRMDAITAIVSE